jgi:radical SAM superfamily enzyme YgiQ (UPF0313 family)
MRYEGKMYRPPSEWDAYILQATIGCSWNHCTYCDKRVASESAGWPVNCLFGE